MCKYGKTIKVEVTIPENLSHKKESYKKLAPIDSCIANIIDALEKGNVLMNGSCCGHNKKNGIISLQDGRELIINNVN